jgi:uncharacterized protein (DUF302 family)
MSADNGIVDIGSPYSVDETVSHLTSLLQAREVKIFAIVDHSGEASKAGLSMRPTKVLIFGNPKAGTPVMLAAPSAAIDLPLKVLVWEDEHGKVWASYNSAEYLQKRHGFPADLCKNIAIVGTLVQKAVE